MDIAQRLKQQFTDCHPSEIAAAIAAGKAFVGSYKGQLTEYDGVALAFLHAAKLLTRSPHLRHCYQSSIDALLHPYRQQARGAA